MTPRIKSSTPNFVTAALGGWVTGIIASERARLWKITNAPVLRFLFGWLLKQNWPGTILNSLNTFWSSWTQPVTSAGGPGWSLASLVLLLIPATILAALALVRFSGIQFSWQGLLGPGGLFAIVPCLVAFWGLVSFRGHREWREHSNRLGSIPVRIHVSGSRGKTGTSRLIDAALRAGGKKVFTKTTGKVPATIDVFGIETRIPRKGAPNIREQLHVIKKASSQGAEALVVECMALDPELQRVSEEKLVKATIAVITNIRRDHLDVMGPDLEAVARNICRIIPRNGVVVTCEERLLPIIRQEAKRRNAAVLTVNPDIIPDEIIEAFPYVTFKDNVAIALEVARLLWLGRDECLEGMLNSSPDIGCARVHVRTGKRGAYSIVQALGVNDADSMLHLHRELVRRGKLKKGPLIGLFHSRHDRVLRSAEFAQLMARDMPFERIVVTGNSSHQFARMAVREGFPKNRIFAMNGAAPHKVAGVLDDVAMEDSAVFACGNFSGAQGLIEVLLEEKGSGIRN